MYFCRRRRLSKYSGSERKPSLGESQAEDDIETDFHGAKNLGQDNVSYTDEDYPPAPAELSSKPVPSPKISFQNSGFKGDEHETGSDSSGNSLCCYFWFEKICI